MKKQFHTLTINHRFGVDTSVFGSLEALKHYLYDYVKHWWSSETENHKMPKDKQEAIDAYFEHVGNKSESEWYDVGSSELDPRYNG